ncbi:MAG: hypothetical protein WCF19_05450 [Chlamydiales bacterium]
MTLVFLFAASAQYGALEDIFVEPEQHIVLSLKKIEFEKFPEAFNPSLFKLDRGYLLTFRYCPDRIHQNWFSYIGVVLLNEFLEPAGEPEILNTRPKNSKTPSQTEDARIFAFRNKLFLIYNDNINEIFFDQGKRRDMFIAELFLSGQKYQLSSPLKLFFEEKYNVLQQKNWVPFEWGGQLYFSYSLNPHEVLSCNLKNGVCYSAYKSAPPIQWPYGTLRGSTPAELVDGEYLAFFHSAAKLKSPASYGWKLWHYFMGAYTFSPTPPFKITKMSPKPIMADEFYTASYREKRVVFPGGYVAAGPLIHVAYGKDDCEIWIATLDKEALLKSLQTVD